MIPLLGLEQTGHANIELEGGGLFGLSFFI